MATSTDKIYREPATMLTDEIVALLSDTGRSLSTIAAAVVACLTNVDEDSFYLACEVLFMLEETCAAVDDTHGTAERSLDAEVIARIVNGEFLLFKLYQSYGAIELNPFLSHFVTVYRHGVELGQVKNEVDRLHKLQASVVSRFLSLDAEQGLGSLSAAQVTENYENLLKTVDTARFVDALINQGVMDPPETGNVQSNDDRNEGAAAASDQKYEVVQKLLRRASVEQIPENESEALVALLKSDVTLLMSSIDLSINAVTSLLNTNPDLGRYLITLLLSTGLRSEVLQVLQLLPPSLPVLESLNHLLVPFALPSGLQPITTSFLRDDEKSDLLHPFLSNATRVIENKAQEHESDSGVFHEDASGQTRTVQLLCLFIQSLLRTGAIKLEDYIYEIQSLTISFVYVPEARKLFQVVQHAMAQQADAGQPSQEAAQRMSVQVL